MVFFVITCVFSGVCLKQFLESEFDAAGIYIGERDTVIERMATHVLASKADSTLSKYSQQVKLFKKFSCTPAHSIHVICHS